MITTHEPITPAQKIDGIARDLANQPSRQAKIEMVTRLKQQHGHDKARAIRDRAVAMLRSRKRARRVETPAARATDPDTSSLAAEAVTRSGQRGENQQVVGATVAKHPGCTSRELAGHCVLDRYEIARRLPECETGGSVHRGSARKCSVSSRKAMTWWPCL